MISRQGFNQGREDEQRTQRTLGTGREGHPSKPGKATECRQPFGNTKDGGEQETNNGQRRSNETEGKKGNNIIGNSEGNRGDENSQTRFGKKKE